MNCIPDASEYGILIALISFMWLKALRLVVVNDVIVGFIAIILAHGGWLCGTSFLVISERGERVNDVTRFRLGWYLLLYLYLILLNTLLHGGWLCRTSLLIGSVNCNICFSLVCIYGLEYKNGIYYVNSHYHLFLVLFKKKLVTGYFQQ